MIALFIALVFFFYFIVEVYLHWEEQFAAKRVQRSNKFSKSHAEVPQLKSYAENLYRIGIRATAHEHNFGNVEDEYTPRQRKVKDMSSSTIREEMRLASRSSTLTPNTDAPSYDSTIVMKATQNGTKPEKKKKTNYGTIVSDVKEQFRLSTFGGYKMTVCNDALDMDHHYISFFQYFFWGMIMVGPNALWLWLSGSVILLIRHYLHKRGLIKPKPFDGEAVVSNLLLESAIAIHYQGMKRNEEGNLIAGFFFPDFPIVTQDGGFAVADLLQVDIDLKKKRMVCAKIDDKELSAREVVILIFFYTISAFHVKLHSISNWAINLEKPQIQRNPFVARNSVITTLYNYFGYSTFSKFFPAWKLMGLLGEEWRSDSWVDTVAHGISENAFSHPFVSELAPYSEFINFHCNLRPFFLQEFSKVKKSYFPGCNGQALYIGTIMHSLDHCRMDWNIEDPLWLDNDHPEYGRMAEIGRIVKVGFVSDLPGLLFHKRFKGSGHPFYDAIYKKAATINVKLADCMDTCIVK